MFARTERLLLRPGFPEDAPALAAARVGETLTMAEAFLAQPRDPLLPSLLITERTDGAPRIVGGCRLGRRPSGAIEMRLWVARQHSGRGIATEAGAALVDIARTLRLPTLEASHFLDDAASGRVLEKLGFAPTGIIAPRARDGRGDTAPARLMRLCLCCDRELEPLAA
jgi:RimJ/RimL family protein N-acetyltransferase